MPYLQSDIQIWLHYVSNAKTSNDPINSQRTKSSPALSFQMPFHSDRRHSREKRQSLLPFHVDFKWSFVLISPIISSSSVCLWSNQTFNWESETSSQSLYQTPAECIYFLQGSWRYKYKSTGKLDGGRENKKHRLWEVKCLIATTKRVTLHQHTASFKADSRGTKNVCASVNVWTKHLCSRPHARIIHLSANNSCALAGVTRAGADQQIWHKVTVMLHMGPGVKRS